MEIIAVGNFLDTKAARYGIPNPSSDVTFLQSSFKKKFFEYFHLRILSYFQSQHLSEFRQNTSLMLNADTRI